MSSVGVLLRVLDLVLAAGSCVLLAAWWSGLGKRNGNSWSGVSSGWTPGRCARLSRCRRALFGRSFPLLLQLSGGGASPHPRCPHAARRNAGRRRPGAGRGTLATRPRGSPPPRARGGRARRRAELERRAAGPAAASPWNRRPTRPRIRPRTARVVPRTRHSDTDSVAPVDVRRSAAHWALRPPSRVPG